MINKKRRSFTLLEILITIGIIALALGAIGINIGKALKEEEFHTATTLLQSKIRLCREIAINYDTDLALSLKKQNEGIICLIHCPPFLPEKIKTLVNRDALIKGFKKITLDGEEKDRLVLSIYPYDAQEDWNKIAVWGEAESPFYFGGT